MKRHIAILFLVLVGIPLLLIATTTFGVFDQLEYVISSKKSAQHLFHVQSIDTMKYSRDRAEQILNNPAAFDALINKQMALIEAAGATHVAINTPYDARFIPVLEEWVHSARAHHLSVWFRGNFSGWEGWFGYEKIDRAEHKRLLTQFIRNNPSLFMSGDILTPCPECENGGPGDPRQSGDNDGYNSFLVEEKEIADAEFRSVHKLIPVYVSMNADIARYILTPIVASKLGGTILIDHYTRSVEQFAVDIKSLRESLHANIGLGEFGAPIPDLNGEMSDAEQGKFVHALFDVLYQGNDVVPVTNYWVLKGGSTALLNDDDTPRQAYKELSAYYKAPYLHGTISNSLGEPLRDTTIVIGTSSRKVVKGSDYSLYLPGAYRSISIISSGYKTVTLQLPVILATSTRQDVYLSPTKPTFWYNMKLLIHKLGGKRNTVNSSL